MAVADLYSFSYTGKIVSWTVPATGAYQILAYGGQGGKGGGLGAEIGGTFILQAGQALTILVGNEADPPDLVRRYAFAGGGGGGGTFVVGAQTTPLIVAGGGGGNTGAAYSQNGLIFSQSPRRYQDGAAGTAGNRGFGTRGGENGGGGETSKTRFGGGGGGGLRDNGETRTDSHQGFPGKSFVNGGAGGLNIDYSSLTSSRANDAVGAFGGGGAGAGGGGGGGGYSGGGGGQGAGVGGGGGSYDAGLDQILIAGAHSGAGLAVITFLGPTVVTPPTTVIDTDTRFSVPAGNHIVQASAADTISAGSGSDTISSGAQSVVVQAGAGVLDFIAGSAAATVLGGTGDSLLYGSTGAGMTLFSAGAGNDTLIGGYGPSLLIGGENTVEITRGSGPSTLLGGSGSTVINGAEGSGAEFISAGSGTATIRLNDAADTVLAGSGAATVSAGAGGEVFGFVAGHAGGSEVIIGFTNQDVLAFAGYGYTLQNAPAEQLTAAGDLMTLNDGTTVLFTGLNQAIF